MKTLVVVAALASGCVMNKSTSTTTTSDSTSDSTTDSTAPAAPSEAGPVRYQYMKWDDWKASARMPKVAATKDAEGNYVPWGGAPSATPATCDAAHDHCLRGLGFFLDSGGDRMTFPVFVVDGVLRSYTGPAGMAWTNRFFVTVPATAEMLTSGRQAIGYKFDPNSPLPESEEDAATSKNWVLGGVDRVDAAAGIVVMDGQEFPIGKMRALIELVEMP